MPEFPLINDDSAWNTLYYDVYLDDQIKITNLRPDTNDIKFNIYSGGRVEMVRKNLDNKYPLVLYKGSRLSMLFQDDNGDAIPNTPVGYIKGNIISTGNYSSDIIWSGIGNNSNYFDIIIQRDLDSFRAYSNTICVAEILIGEEFNISISIEI